MHKKSDVHCEADPDDRRSYRGFLEYFYELVCPKDHDLNKSKSS